MASPVPPVARRQVRPAKPAEPERCNCNESRNNVIAVRRALEEDGRCRVPGVTDGIYGLDALKPFSRIRHGVPVICVSAEEFADRADTDVKFRERAMMLAPVFEGLDMKALGLVAAGGACAATLMHAPEMARHKFHDWDLFLVGHQSDEDAHRAIMAFTAHLEKTWGDFQVARTQGCVTFYKPAKDLELDAACLIQIILRRYSTLAEVIHGFDLGSSAVAFDGERVYMTRMGLFAANHGANILNLKTRRASYEHRLARYLTRGYDLVLPDFDPSKFEYCQSIWGNQLRGRLPFLDLGALTQMNPHCMCALRAAYAFSSSPGRPSVDPNAEPEEPASDYGYEINYTNPRQLMMKNLRAVDHETGEIRAPYLVACRAYAPGLDVTALKVEIDIEVALEVLKYQVCKHSGNLQVKTLMALLGKEGAVGFMLDFMSNKCKLPADDRLREYIATYTQTLQARKDFAIPFRFMRVEDGTALVGPFPRVLVTEPDWYGAAYAE